MLFDIRYLLAASGLPIVKNGENNDTSNYYNQETHQNQYHHNQLSTQIDLANLRLDKFSLLRTNNWHSFNLIDSLRPYVEARRAHLVSDRNEPNPAELLLVMESNRDIGRNARGSTKSTTSIDLSNPYIIVYSKEQDAPMKQFFQVYSLIL